MTVTLFICGRRPEPCQALGGCSGRAAGACEFALKGRKEGQVCGRKLCTEHLCPQPDGKRYCRVHDEVAKGAIK